MIKPYTVRSGFRWLIASLSLLACASSFAVPRTDAISEIEAYLDQIRTKIDSIQQSVDGVEDPPLAEKIAETFSLETCFSLETLMQLGVGAGLEVPVTAEGKANPGAAIIQGLAKAHAKLNGSLSLGVNGNLGAGFSVCFDLWKIGKALKEEFELQAMETGVDPRVMESPTGLLGDLSMESRQYLKKLSSVNPTALYNTLLDPTVNAAFGFNLDRTTVVAEALFDEIGDVQFSLDPKNIISDVETRLNKFADVLPFAEVIDIDSLIGDPEKLNPCNYAHAIPFGSMSGCDELQEIAVGIGANSAVEVVGWYHHTLGNLLELANIKAALELANTLLNDIKNMIGSTATVGSIKKLIKDVASKKKTLCTQLDPIVDC